jgi:hypothetical protein
VNWTPFQHNVVRSPSGSEKRPEPPRAEPSDASPRPRGMGNVITAVFLAAMIGVVVAVIVLA